MKKGITVNAEYGECSLEDYLKKHAIQSLSDAKMHVLAVAMIKAGVKVGEIDDNGFVKYVDYGRTKELLEERLEDIFNNGVL